MFQLICLSKNYLSTADTPTLQNITHLINVAYSKAIHKYHVIKTPRVKDHTTVMRDFQMNSYPAAYIYLLLAPSELVTSPRDFYSPVESLEDSFRCDVPAHAAPHFSFGPADVEVVVPDSSYQFSDAELQRCIGSIGLKSHRKTVDSVVRIEFTAFTSYLRGLGPRLFEVVIQRCLLDKEHFARLSDASGSCKVVLHGDCVREHGLVEYYVNKCGFRVSGEDTVVNVGESPWEEGLGMYRGFHIAYIEREIHLSSSEYF